MNDLQPTKFADPDERRILEIQKPLLGKNQAQAEANRAMFDRLGITVINLLSSPGAGKTSLLEHTLNTLSTKDRCGVIVGDLATDNDARRLHRYGCPVLQITTGNVCHLESDMIARGCQQLDLDGLDFLFIENVGNLVCPAAYDLGEHARVVLFATTEGEDKPRKYPVIYRRADLVLLTKIDLEVILRFDRSLALACLQATAPQARILPISTRCDLGMESWYSWLRERRGSRRG